MSSEAVARTALQAAREAYAAGRGRAPQPVIGGFEWVRPIFHSETGFHAELYHNAQTDEVLVAFAGTERSARDAFTDLNLGWTQWNGARDLVFDGIREAAQGSNAAVHFTGHSLGGALAQFAAYEYRASNPGAAVTLTTFNALGGVAALTQNLAIPAADIAERMAGVRVTHFRVRDDLVSRLGEGHVGGNVVELDLRPLPGLALSFLDAHRLETFERALSNGRQLSEAVPVAVSYLSIRRSQPLAAALSNFASDGRFNEAEAMIRVAGALTLAIQFADGEELNALVHAALDNQAQAGLLTDSEYNVLASIDYAALRHASTATGVIPVAAASLVIGSGLKDFVESRVLPEGEAALVAARERLASVMGIARSVSEFGRLQHEARVAASVEALEATVRVYREVVSSAAAKFAPLFSAYEQAVSGAADAAVKAKAFYDSLVALMADQFERVAEIAGLGQERVAAIGASVLAEGRRALDLGTQTARSLLEGLAARFELVFGAFGASVLQRLSAATNPIAGFPVEPGTGTDPDGNGVVDLPSYRVAFDVLGEYQRAAGSWRIFRGDPLVLDLAGDGIQLVQVSASQANFDLDGDGVRERVGWIGPTDAFLVLDADGDGEVRDIGELFGSETETGFAELARHDLPEAGGNGDGRIDAADRVFAELKLWRDLNGDGDVDAGELRPIGEYELRSISLAHTPFTAPASNPGTILTELGSYTLADGSVRLVGDALLERQTLIGAVHAPLAEAPALEGLPDFRGYGAMRSLRGAMARDEGLEAQVRGLLAGGPQQLLGGLDALLYRWAGVEGIPPASRGPAMDARRLAALEVFTGTPYRNVQTGANPDAVQASILEGAWARVREHYAARFLVFGTWFREIFPRAAYSAGTDFLVLNEDPRNVGLRLRNLRAAGDPQAQTAIDLLPLIYRNSESGRDDLLLFDGAAGSHTVSSTTGIAFTDLGAGADTLRTGTLHGLHYTGPGDDTVTFTYGGDHTVINEAGNDVLEAQGPGNFTIYALGGNNRIRLRGGSHVISTAAGGDTIDLGSGDHFVDAGEGHNFINTSLLAGQTGTVFIRTGAGNDQVGSA
ncbi:MAG: DUF2974 domain-containing protein, partial [Rhodocyclaceae bacterium]|nr:DUF2974 domain-containing protein [Rhodocyclaceae bacterium]